ncbi:type I polyketide synthase [Actinokineospora sp. UTMC 2448]|uniref:type I polyketide synthase n=1 Tax=Actinokineospora sp. UTMC 2448 TaxID=2268449 RepID=UPI002163FFE0|nr:type I polyketide synthase [Actinokineospora sp. UTMC 2448]UVS77563.1 Erythronolide synthase, modules 5 and 6 [Actinokineospora sp. UTMC 2448]
MAAAHEPVAIVGIGLRTPGGSRTPEEFAEFLAGGGSGIGTRDGQAGGYLDRIDEFDAAFFGLTPVEAQYTDPTHRLLLETVWEALENAAIDPTGTRGGNGGVYVGAGTSDYALEIDRLRDEDLDGALAAGITPFALSGRLSYFLDWRGPSMTVDAAGASSLTALHQAIVGLRRRECEIALCAAANTLHNPRPHAILKAANVLSSEGRVKAFDDAADGYVRAEGAAAIVLKRLTDAKRDGDRVLAVVRGTAVGQDGDGPGISVPNGAAQERVIRAALDDARIEPAEVSYVEAHGLGTPLGDPIELGAIADVFTSEVAVGSVKTNVGHLEPAAGLVGLVKAVLQIQTGRVFAHLNFETPSARIPWDRYPITVPTESRDWAVERRCAVVNSFGFGGAIAAAVVEQPPAPPEPAEDDGAHVFTLSAKNRRALRAQIERYRDHQGDLADLCYTAAVGRAHFKLRVAGVVRTDADLRALLDQEPDDGPEETPKVAFLFDDNHVQHDDTALRAFPVYRAAAEECEHAGHGKLFTTQYALAQLWLSWGVKPGIMVGRGTGEIVAATVSGLFTVTDAAKVVAGDLDGVRFGETTLAFVAALSGKVARRGEITKPDYWVRQAAEPPDFAAALGAVERRGAHVLLELGPPTGEPGRLPCLGGDDAHLRALAELYRQGVAVRWAGFYRGRERVKAVLPTYAFDRKRFWLPAPAPRLDAQHHPLLGVEADWPQGREFRAVISPDHPAYLADHVVGGQVVFPGAGYVEILLALQDAVFGDAGRTLTEVRIREPLFVTEHTELRTRVCHAGAAEILSVVDGGVERVHATAMLGGARHHADPGPPGRDLRARASGAGRADDVRETEELYPDFAAVGMGYGPAFQRIRAAFQFGADFAVGDLRGERTAGMEFLPPPVLDGALHTIAPLIDDGHNYLPVRFGEVRLFKKPKSDDLRVLLRLTDGEDDRTADLLVLEDDEPVVEVRGLGFKRLAAGPGFLHRRVWVKRSQLPPAGDEPRHVQFIGGDAAVYAERAKELGVQLSTGDEPLDGVTDVCWFWRPDAEAPACPGKRLWVVTERAQWLPGDTGSTPAAVWGADAPGILVDLPPGGDPAFAQEWVRDTVEPRLAYRDGHRYVRRLLPAAKPSDENIALTITEHGRFADIKPLPAPDELPSGSDIQVRVHAAGLNFKDVLNALGMLKQHAESTGAEYAAQPLGFECAGTVLAAGPTASFAPGDEVIVNYSGLMRRRVTVPSVTAVAKPARLTWAEAAGQASAYVTAHYALHHLARMKAGDRVLIHAAAGGVGQAAVQLARAAGAEVYATASPHKWPVLAAQGVEHLMNSRTLDFADQIPGGVDIVLNSLNKEFIPAGLRTLADGGRFIELGKVGVWAPEQVAAEYPHVEYHNFDFSELPADEVTRINREIMTDVATRLARGDLDPVTTTAYTLDEVEEAFGVLSRGANVGKLVLAFDQPAPRPVAVRPDRTYVITGADTELGRLTEAKLTAMGATHLALVTNADDLAGLTGRPPVGGVVHAAEDPGLAWALHEAAFPDLDFFVTYSRLAALVGIEHRPEDEALDHLAHRRANAGLPALNIAWGPLGEARDGLHAVTPAKAMRTFAALLGTPDVSVTAGAGDWTAEPLFEALAKADGGATGAQIDRAALLSLPPDERRAAVEDFIRVKVAEVLRFPDADEVGPRTKFARLGLDSLVAVELKNALEAAFAVPLPAAVAFDHPTAAQLAEFLDGLLTG